MNKKSQHNSIRNIIFAGLAILLAFVWIIATDRVNAAPIAELSKGETFEETIKPTMRPL